MPASYEIEQDVLILRLAPDSFPRMAEIVRAATEDAAFRPGVRLLIDLQGVVFGLNYEDMRAQVRSLTGMGPVLAPIWAVLTTSAANGMSAAGMFSILGQIEDVTVHVFDDEQEARLWLRNWNRPGMPPGE